MTNDTDRIQNAIRHIKTAVDVDPWAVEIAVEAMEKQIPKKPKRVGYFLVCPICYGRNGLFDDNYVVTKQIGHDENISHCLVCGQAIDWESE